MTVTNPALPLSAAEVERTCLPLEQATMLPGAAFTDSRSSSGSVPTSSREGWICAGHIEQGRGRGRVPDDRVGGESVLVVGDDDGLPRAFLNTCRHRGARLVDRARGHGCGASSARTTRGRTASTAACKNAPFTEGLEDFDPKCFALHEVRLAVVEGLVLLDLSRRGAAAAGAHRRPRAAARALPPRRAQARRADRLRRRRQLEGDRRELQRVPALPGRASGAQPPLALPQRRDDRGRRACGAAAR